MFKLVLLRHGESIWNRDKRFTGWTDIDLSTTGIKQAKEAGKILKKDGYVFDISFTSMLKRSIRSLGIPLVYELNQMLKPLDKYYLSEDKKVEEAIEFIKN